MKWVKEVNKLFFTFLWNGKGNKIKRNTIFNDYPNGGLKMIDIVSFSKSLKATWMKKKIGCRKPSQMETFLWSWVKGFRRKKQLLLATLTQMTPKIFFNLKIASLVKFWKFGQKLISETD